jgi:hypothetical protein
MLHIDIHLPRTPVIQLAPLEASTSGDVNSSLGSSSTSICASPLEEPTHPVDIIKQGLYPYTALEEQFLRMLTIFLATLLHAQAMAIVPNDHWVT